MADLKANYIIKYEGRDITKDIAPLLISLSFTDRLEGKAGDLELELADHERKFLGSWFPETNDRIEVWMGRLSEPLLFAAKFWIDETSFNGGRSGYKTTIRAMSTPPANVVSLPKRASFVGKQLKDLASDIANQMGLKLSGDISGVIRENQKVSDLAFLETQATKNGYIMKVENGNLIFKKYADLRSQNGYTIDIKDVLEYDMKDKFEGKYSRCNVLWYDAAKKKQYQGYSTLPVKGGSTATIWEEVDSDSNAVERAKNWLENKKKRSDEIHLTLVGDVRALAGVPITIKGFGKKDGKYIIKESIHTINRKDGYVTKIKLHP